MASTNFPGYDQNPIYEQQQGRLRVPNLMRMKYKDYTWPHNPATYNIRFSKRIVEHTFMQIDNAEIEEMGLEARVMSGSGSFFGPDAYTEFGKLATVYYQRGPGALFHPIWQDANVVFTKLELRQEPLPDYIEYDFEFVEHVDINVIEEVAPVDSSSSGTSASASSPSGNSVNHIVKQGETLSGIGAKYGVPWRQIADDNKSIISNPNTLQIGWSLVINDPKQTPNSSGGSNLTGDKAYDRYMRDFGGKYSGEYGKTHGPVQSP